MSLFFFQLPQQNGGHNGQNVELLDVMFWIHGGAFFSGSSKDYPPQYLMDKNVVYVSTNYRLGVYGKSRHNKMELSRRIVSIFN
jgi:carboxylesterase type B